MEINNISIGRMNSGAHFLYHTDFYARIQANAEVKEKLTNVLNRYKTAIDNEDAALKISQKSLNTDYIWNFDSKRDALFAAIKAIVRAQLTVSDASINKAARTLDQLIKDYRIDTKEQVDKETGLLINLINDMETKYAVEIEKLALGMFLAQLKEANDNVRKYTDSRNQELLDKPAFKLAEARKMTDEVYQEVVKLINAYVVIEGNTLYKNLIMLQNQEISHYKQQVLKQPASPSAPTVPGGPETPSDPSTPTDPEPPGGGEDDRPVIE